MDKVKQLIGVSPKFDREFADRFKDKTRHSTEFLDYLTSSSNGEPNKLQLMANIEDCKLTAPCSHDRDLPYDEKKWNKLILDFFKKCLPEKSQEAEQILDKSHPLFTDKNGASHINVIHAKKGDNRSSSVDSPGNDYLEMTIYIHDSLDDLRTTAHEIAHAISSHHQQHVKIFRNGASAHEADKLTAFDCDKQSIGEIESHIVEALFNQYLLSNNIYDENDMQNYVQQQKNSLQCEINHIREESDVITDLQSNASVKSLNALYKHYKTTGKKRLADRIEKMGNGSPSSHMFRYVVGRVVADRWINKFNQTTKAEKEAMLTQFQAYLSHTHEMGVDEACQALLGERFSTLAQEYAQSMQTENSNNHQL